VLLSYLEPEKGLTHPNLHPAPSADSAALQVTVWSVARLPGSLESGPSVPSPLGMPLFLRLPACEEERGEGALEMSLTHHTPPWREGEIGLLLDF
jgi:hypothetical protein